ncbi:MAG TPA: WbuC family cupin fold metalloprotein [Chloroflexota bacterium]
MPSFFGHNEDILEVGPDWLPRLKEAAAEQPRRRARLNLHHGAEDAVQEMVIAFCGDSVLPPHKNLNKSESFHVIEGELQVVVFDDDGTVTRTIDMGPLGSGQTFMYRLARDLWHTVIPRSDFVIIHEVTRGPFLPGDTAFPEWGPDEGPATKVFLEQALQRFHDSPGVQADAA